MKTLFLITAALVLAACEHLSDDPCRGLPGCTTEAPQGNHGPIIFTDANGNVIATWRGMTQAPR